MALPDEAASPKIALILLSGLGDSVQAFKVGDGHG
jgi:hypothetical protein